MSGTLLVLALLAGAAPMSPDTGGASQPDSARPGPVVLAPAGPAALRVVPEASADRWLAEDKARHFTLSFAAASMTYGAARAMGVEGGTALAVAGGTALVAGVWKELRDRRIEGETASWKDLVWDALGISAAIALAAGT